MVPAMDMYMKSSPALSQTSEGEAREKTEVGEEKRVTKEKTGTAKADNLCMKRIRRHDTVCVVLTPLNGKSLDIAQRPLKAKLW